MKLVSLVLVVLASSLVAGCVSAADPGVRMRAAVPGPMPAPVDEGAWEEVTFAGAGGRQLYAQSWRPPEGAAVRGVVAIHHGLADHSDRYQPLGEILARAGYAVWAMDMRGHGRSSGARVRMEEIDVMLDDLEAFLRLVRQRAPQAPLFLYGHSVGGLISALYAIERQPELAGLVLAAPGLAFEAPPLQAAAIQLVNALASGAPILETPHADFSSVPAVVAAMDRDPLIHQGKGPARTARAAIDAVERVWAAPERLRAPLLVLHGDIDKLTAPSGSRDLVARASTPDRTLRIYPGLAHDVMHEPQSPRVQADLRAWLDAHTGGSDAKLAASLAPSADAAAPAPRTGDAATTSADAAAPAPRTGDAATTAQISGAAAPAPAADVAATRSAVLIGTAAAPLTGQMRGDARGELLALELDVRGELPQDDALDGDPAITAGLRLRFGRGRAAAAGLGYHGGLDVRAGALDGGYYELAAHLVGLAARSAHGASLALTGGVSLGGVRGATATSAPVELALEAPLGPVRLLARGGLAFRLGGDEYAGDAGFADEASALLGVRLFRDHRYWASTVAGAGPFLAVTYRNLGDAELWGIALGTQLWGGN